MTIINDTQYFKESSQYFKTDNNTIINKIHIKWIKKTNNCLDICRKSEGCTPFSIYGSDTHRICKLNNPNSYAKIDDFFQSIT